MWFVVDKMIVKIKHILTTHSLQFFCFLRLCEIRKKIKSTDDPNSFIIDYSKINAARMLGPPSPWGCEKWANLASNQKVGKKMTLFLKGVILSLKQKCILTVRYNTSLPLLFFFGQITQNSNIMSNCMHMKFLFRITQRFLDIRGLRLTLMVDKILVWND